MANLTKEEVQQAIEAAFKYADSLAVARESDHYTMNLDKRKVLLDRAQDDRLHFWNLLHSWGPQEITHSE